LQSKSGLTHRHVGGSGGKTGGGVGGTDMLSRQDKVDSPRSGGRSPTRAEGSKLTGPPSENFEKYDCRKRVFQAFQTLCSHFEGRNFKETAGRTGF